MSDDKKKRAARTETIHAVIDRLEDNDMAVILFGEDEKWQLDLPKKFLPEGAGEGDHLTFTIKLDRESRAAAEEKTRKLIEEIEKQKAPPEQKNFKL
jgi:hypothetical protein